MTWCKCLEGIFPSLCDGYVAGRKPILTPRWNCFLDLLFIAFIIIIQNGLPQRVLPLCLMTTPRCLLQNPVHLWMAGRKKLTHPLPEVCYPRRCFQDSVQFSHSVVSDSLWPHGLQHAKPPCPSPIPGVYSNSCLLNQWCNPTISSSIIPFSSTFNLSQYQGLFQWASSSHQMVKVLEFQLQHQFFQWIFRTDFL